jgi:hypothetical protein
VLQLWLMRVPTVQCVATAVFALGFVLTGSGLSHVLRIVLDDRPSWSVCGEDMCSCLPTAMPEDCPLCALGGVGVMGFGERVCSGEGDREAPVKRVPKHDETVKAIDGAVSASASMLYLSMFVWRGRGLDVGSDGLGRWALVETDDPGSRAIGVPTPPPRG